VFIEREMRFERDIFADESEGGVAVPAAGLPGKRRPGRPRLSGRRGKKTGKFTLSR
jgi:hypothetical protein